MNTIVPTPIKPFNANPVPMDAFDAYFPYDAYRPHQRDMLEFAAQCAREGGVGMRTEGLSVYGGFNDLCLGDATVITMM
jgi:hypothetical protein